MRKRVCVCVRGGGSDREPASHVPHCVNLSLVILLALSLYDEYQDFVL